MTQVNYEELLPEEKFSIEYRVRIRGKNDNEERWKNVTKGFEDESAPDLIMTDIECKKVTLRMK